MLAVVTGPVRSGKSRVALGLALASRRDVVIAVGGLPDDPEMAERIARHQAERPSGLTVIETAADPVWIERVPAEACLLVDCLGTVLGTQISGHVPPDADLLPPGAETAASADAETLVEWLCARSAPTVIVTNEVGWGLVPAYPLGRLFRDVMGRATRSLVSCADRAWLVVGGRCIDLTGLPEEATW